MGDGQPQANERVRWALDELDRYIDLCDSRKAAWNRNDYPDRDRLDDEIHAQVGIVLRILGTYWPGFKSEPDKVEANFYGPAGAIRGTVVVQRALLERRDEISANLKRPGPQIAANELHPWVWEAAKPFWSSKHYRQAVVNAAAAINANLQTKLGRRDVSGTALVQQAFSDGDPEPGKPRLRFVDVPTESEDWRSRHLGAMQFGQGCFMAIRNIADHAPPETEYDPQIALEQLAALSVLARWVDEATVVYAGGGA